MANITRPVRIQRIHTPHGVSTGEATAICPVSNQRVALAECKDCPRLQKSVQGPATAAACLVCAVPDEAPKPVKGPTEHAHEEFEALLRLTPVAEVMTQDVSCVTADVSLEALAKLFDARQISCAPVVDEVGNLIGLVTKTDVICEFYDLDQEPPVDVADVMTTRPTTVQELATLAEVVHLLPTTHHLPVTSASGKVVGILSTHDVIRWLARPR